MTTSILSVFLFLQQFVVPVVFAIGVIFFLYGLVNSFWLERPDLGHPALIRAMLFFVVSLVIYGAVVLLLWLVGAYETGLQDRSNGTNSGFGADVDRGRSVLPTPNAPQGNEE